MKINTKILCGILLTLFSLNINAQTNVSGGIYTNTTWSLTSSPYIVTANVIVFPGVTLTIQPGVTVKFDNGTQLEIRQAALIALGTNIDSITFTSNGALSAGSWNNIDLNGGTMTSKFNYCNFRYATAGISDNRGGTNDTLIVKNSNFNFNTSGLFGQGTFYGIIDTCNFRNNGTGLSSNYGGILTNCDISYNSTGFSCDAYNTLNNCSVKHNQTGMGSMRNSTVTNSIVKYNQTGISIVNSGGAKIKNTIIDSNSVIGIDMSGNNDSIYNCEIRYNGIGLRHLNSTFSWPNVITKNRIENNATGIQLAMTIDNIYCNKICNNSTYDLQYTGTTGVSVKNNYWCTSDSISTEVVIYDGYDNPNYGPVSFMPIDSTCSSTTGINETHTFSFCVFPNPAVNYVTVELPSSVGQGEIRLFNLLGDLKYSTCGSKSTTDIDISSLANGIYFLEVNSGSGNGRQKFIKQ